tara:strand:- start:12722 stop:13681 length:960 start_codon:yes stop_codon:yes gene_type:complete
MSIKQLVFDRNGIQLDYDNQTLVIREPPHGVRTLPLRYLRRVVCLHSVSVSTALLGQLWQRGIDFVVINSRSSDTSFALYPNQTGVVERRCRQYQWQQTDSLCLPLATALCQHRLHIQQRILARRTTNTTPTELPLIAVLTNLARQMPQTTDAQQLRGLEGHAQKLMFQYWREQLPDKLGFQKRQRRPPPDPVNALLSLTYTLVLQEAIRQCIANGLDSQLGFYHRVAHGRHSLACDLMEVARPYCEAWVVDQFRSGELDLRHFTRPRTPNVGCMLGKAGRSHYYSQVAPAMQEWRKPLAAAARWVRQTLDHGLLEPVA